MIPAVTSGGITVAVHELGGAGPTLLLSHATGFHGRCFQPLAGLLADHFRCVALDYRGHGDTPAPAGWDIHWEGYGDDAEHVATALVDADGEPIVGFGHSMGGAALLMAAHRHPGLFGGLVLFEPVVIADGHTRPDDQPSLVDGARRRRASFASIDEALANYRSKPPLSSFSDAALRAYVEHGVRAGADGRMHLKCEPEHEARTFEQSASHRTWEVLGEIDVPVAVVAGRVDEFQPSAMAAGVAERLPRSTYIELPDLDHFAPMTHPGIIATIIARHLAGRAP